MVEAESTESDGAPSAPLDDWTKVRGFQVLAAAGADAEAPAADPDAHARLAKELSARAARFSQSVDDSIVLASDGVIRWLGDPVARLIAGDDLLKPKTILLADEALSAEDREAVQTRLSLWMTAHVSKVLGPLEALAEPGAVAEPVRALAVRIAQALGVLERERVRQQVKTLDQNARAALRKLGVRFGAMYIFIPALLKPGARTLCSQLWGLRRGEAGTERLLAFAAAGRTSFAAEAPLSADTYRVAGFRLCGDRVVRIDIVERLNDLIRAAIPDHLRSGAAAASEAVGFLVTPQMTSLTGCAGESFASILRSLGYESHRVRRSEFEAAMRKPTAPTKPLEAPVAAPAELAADVASPSPEIHASDGGEDPSLAHDFAGNAIEAAETPPRTQLDLVEAAETASDHSAESEAAPAADEPAAPAFVEAAEAPANAEEMEPAVAGAEASAPGVCETGPPAEPPLVEGAEATPDAFAEAEEAVVGIASTSGDAVETPPDAFAETEEAHVGMASASGDATETPAAEPPGGGETGIVEVADSGDGPAAEEDEWIEVWRPAPRRRPQPPARPVASAQAPRPARDQRRRWGRDSSPRQETAATDAASPEPPAVVAADAPASSAIEEPREGRRPDGGASRGQERARRHFEKGERAEGVRAQDAQRGAKEPAKAPAKKEYRPPPVDMDSPFAKLLALKPLLERRDKRT